MAEAPTQSVQRGEIVTALDGLTVTIDGANHVLRATPTQPRTVEPYTCWPVWVASRPVTWCVSELDWTVLVALPGPDPQTFVAAGDQLTEVVTAALEDWQLTRIEPVQILVGDGQAIPGLQFAITI